MPRIRIQSTPVDLFAPLFAVFILRERYSLLLGQHYPLSHPPSAALSAWPTPHPSVLRGHLSAGMIFPGFSYILARAASSASLYQNHPLPTHWPVSLSSLRPLFPSSPPTTVFVPILLFFDSFFTSFFFLHFVSPPLRSLFVVLSIVVPKRHRLANPAEQETTQAFDLKTRADFLFVALHSFIIRTSRTGNRACSTNKTAEETSAPNSEKPKHTTIGSFLRFFFFSMPSLCPFSRL